MGDAKNEQSNTQAFGQERVAAGGSQGTFANAMAQGEQALGSEQQTAPQPNQQEGVTIPQQQEQAPQPLPQQSYQVLPNNYDGGTPEFEQGTMQVDQQNFNQTQAVDQPQQPIVEQGVQPQEEQRTWQGSYDKEVNNHKETQAKLQFMEQQNTQMATMYQQAMVQQPQPQAQVQQQIVEQKAPDFNDYTKNIDYDAEESRTPGTSSFNAYNDWTTATNNFNTRKVIQEENKKNEAARTQNDLYGKMDKFATDNPHLGLKDAFGRTNYNKIQTDMGSYLTANNASTIMHQMYQQTQPSNIPQPQVQQPQAMNNGNVGGANNLASKADQPQSVATTTGAATGTRPQTQLDNLRGYYGNQFGSGHNIAFPSGGNHIAYNK